MVTIKDVARHTGVTATAVSYVIRGKDGIGEETRTRVLAAIDALGYRPNLIARGLVQRRTDTLALAVSTLTNPFYPEIAEEVERVAREHGYHLLLCQTHGNAALGRLYVEGLLGRMIDGFLVMSGSLPGADLLAMVPRSLPLVLMLTDAEPPEGDVVSVGVDVRGAGELAARHLTELGHRRMAVIAHLPPHHRRLAGFREALATVGLGLPGDYVEEGDSTVQSGYRAAHRLLMSPQRPTAIFATNDLMALGAMEAALDGRLHVPRDLSIIGLDDIALGAHVRPSLTTVAMPKRALVQGAMELLLQRIKDEEVALAPRVVHPYTVIRHSTAAPSRTQRRYHPSGVERASPEGSL